MRITKATRSSATRAITRDSDNNSNFIKFEYINASDGELSEEGEGMEGTKKNMGVRLKTNPQEINSLRKLFPMK